MADDVSYAHTDPLSWLAGCSGHSPHLAGHRGPISDWVVFLIVCLDHVPLRYLLQFQPDRRCLHWQELADGECEGYVHSCQTTFFRTVANTAWTENSLVSFFSFFSIIFFPTILVAWKCDNGTFLIHSTMSFPACKYLYEITNSQS